MSDETPTPPEVLGERGSALWRDLTSLVPFDAKQLSLLLEAGRTLDRIDALSEHLAADGLTIAGSAGQTVLHPAVGEIRQQQLVYGKLTDLLRLPEDVRALDRFRANRARAGAAGRWERKPSGDEWLQHVTIEGESARDRVRRLQAVK
ncbi:MAG: hypothetical protein AB7K08_05330 [Microbacteriaceae bacterium]